MIQIPFEHCVELDPKIFGEITNSNWKYIKRHFSVPVHALAYTATTGNLLEIILNGGMLDTSAEMVARIVTMMITRVVLIQSILAKYLMMTIWINKDVRFSWIFLGKKMRVFGLKYASMIFALELLNKRSTSKTLNLWTSRS